ncbi:hypothetical protein [Desulfovibrio inopinatus]|uniref:hypothetical protein n=1 Tax=Desulfovibrio inopinatus TaxID=102109 RepID=UPI0004102778|nr:hypothetical protein [Desulfovibrio inopinatus]
MDVSYVDVQQLREAFGEDQGNALIAFLETIFSDKPLLCADVRSLENAFGEEKADVLIQFVFNWREHRRNASLWSSFDFESVLERLPLQ